MSKRIRSESPSHSPRKRWRPEHPNHFDSLSDELVLKVVSLLSISDLTRCQRVSHRFLRIASDSQVWKSAFYHRFVRPRVSRLGGKNRQSGGIPPGGYNMRDLKWLDDEGYARSANTNWKKLYKLRHNWDRGSCGVSEVDISTTTSQPPLFVKMREGLIITVDNINGLRAWDLEGSEKTIARLRLGTDDDIRMLGPPTALAVNEMEESRTKLGAIDIAVGFEKGRFVLYRLNLVSETATLTTRYIHRVSAVPSSSKIVNMVYSGSHLATMDFTKIYSLYHFTKKVSEDSRASELDVWDAGLITTLKSHTVWPPHSLSIRRSPHGVFACIVYALPLHGLGWSVGMQELRLDPNGRSIAQSRIALAVPTGFQSIPVFESNTSTSPYASPARGVFAHSLPPPLSQPTSFSYTHPYLLAAHKDNTLTLYLVKSTADSLEIAPGQRLWGHTSSISGAHVGNRGKAVSVSSRGSELRVWDLEGGGSKNRRGRGSVKIYPSPQTQEPVSATTPKSSSASTPLDRSDDEAEDRWLGFDEERVIVHREKDTGSQVLMVYDFT